MEKKILITGAAGFIGYHLSKELCKKNKVIGIDNFLKNTKSKLTIERNKKLLTEKNFIFKKIDISNFKKLESIFKNNKIDTVINLAAIPGVRNSFKNPNVYFKNNITGFYNIYLLSIKYNIKLFIFGSSSSVYGNSKKQETDYPISFYAASKKCNEIIAHSFINASKMKVAGLRFFTVYGPLGRPDMAVLKFAEKIKRNKIIEVYNFGKHSRDFSFIDDTVNSIKLIIKNKKKLGKFQIFDIGKGKNDKLSKLLNIFKKKYKKIKIKKILKQQGDVENTMANTSKLSKIINYSPNTSLEIGMAKFFEWFDKKKNF